MCAVEQTPTDFLSNPVQEDSAIAFESEALIVSFHKPATRI